eukprot:76880_1
MEITTFFSLKTQTLQQLPTNGLPSTNLSNQLLQIKNNNTKHIHSYIPTLKQLEQELLCAVNKNHPKYAQFMKLLSDIYRLQFKQTENECYDMNTQVMIFENLCPETGLFAGIRCWTRNFAEALIQNKTFLFHGKYNFAPYEYCQNFTNPHTTAHECYFSPYSSCNNITKLLLTHLKIYGTKILINGNVNNIPDCILNLIHKNVNISELFDFTNDRFFRHHNLHRITYVKNGKWDAVQRKKYRYSHQLANKYGLNLHELSSFIQSFLLRPQPNIRKQISLGVLQSLMNLQNKWRIDCTVGAQVRWSDKCYQASKKGAPAEMDCFWIDSFLEIAESLKTYLIPNITHTIVTSESKIVIDTAKDLKQHKYLDYELIFNLKDIMQGGSELKYKWLDEHDAIQIMISMLSTIKLQCAATYHLLKSGSQWTNSVYKLASHLDCLPITTNDLLDVQNDIKSIGVSNIQFAEFVKYIKSIEGEFHQRMCIFLESGAFGSNLNGSHIVAFGDELTRLKNSKFSPDFDWKYNATNTFNQWNSAHCSNGIV